MSNVNLTIGGRRYTLGCAEGEEQHIEKLGAAIDSKLSATAGLQGMSEAHTLLYAALLMADEAQEANSGADSNELPKMPPVGEPLEELAERLESLASKLEEQASAP
ncbi:cell division protein ZapA [Alteraurantiacibacter aquimixticola]|uniref:Cell division protein ZapA n=1 Tax=Alteraurantiacibacter aquimixticola TaxID=2489173 RepID=A0A4T3F1Q9_9SPHN|nr:cell division protein ZapA [Alteraurantiacibacter aquimixticola]TIX50215.1 cell division protein ZapA [Alteraurantiacibacter aquimixticola]